jgi:hypothetical protein
MKKLISNKNTAKQLIKRLDDETVKIWRDPVAHTLEVIFKDVEKANTYSIPESLVEDYANLDVFIQILLNKYKNKQVKLKKHNKP